MVFSTAASIFRGALCANTIPLQDGFTPLLFASQEGHTAVVKLLLEAKANPDLQNKVMFAIFV